MAIDNDTHSRRPPFALGALGALTVVIVLGLVISFALPHPAPRKYPNRIPVLFWHMWTAEVKDVVGHICDQFNESQNKYEVIPLSIPSGSKNGSTEADSKFLLSMAGGDPPDLMCQWDPVIPDWAESKLLVPIDTLMSNEERRYFVENAFPVVKKVAMYKGKIYGIPVGTDIFACYYLPQQLRESGSDPNHFPQTLEQLMQWSYKLNRFDSRGRLIRMGFWLTQWSEYAPGFGDGFYDWKHDKFTIDTPGNLRALRFLATEQKKLGWDNIDRFQSGLTSGGGLQWPFITGAYSILVDGQWQVENLRRYAPTLEYRTAPLPPPRGGNKYYGTSDSNLLIIPRGAKHPEGAWEFMKFWSGMENPNRAAAYETWGGWLPAFPAVARAPAYQAYLKKCPQFRVFLDVMSSENVQPLPPVPYQDYFSDRVIRVDDFVARGILTPEQGMKQLVQDMEREKARRKELGYRD